MDIAEKIAQLNSRSEELVKTILACRDQITENNKIVRKLATQLKKTNEILGLTEQPEEVDLYEKEL